MRFLRLAREAFDKGIDHVFNAVQTLISSRYWAVGCAIISISWWVFETFVARKPLEGWFNSWAYTVFFYTVLSLWIENFQKAQTAHMAKIQQEQTDRMEFMLRYLVEAVEAVQTTLKDNQQNNAILRHLVAQWKEMTSILVANKEQKD